MDDLDQRITEVIGKIEEVKSRWPFHSPKVSMVQELENLELELEELEKAKKIRNDRFELTGE
ncbi:MAG: histidine kinase [Dethiobacteria bacterium]|nr:histidine kinase [Dethiobacteria bacterium]